MLECDNLPLLSLQLILKFMIEIEFNCSNSDS